MAEQNAIPIPKNLPAPTKVVNDFVDFMYLPHQLLYGLSLRDLLGWTEAREEVDRFMLIELDLNGADITPKVAYSPITTRAWMVGSRIWRPAVLGESCTVEKDFDFIFADLGASLDFLGKAQKLLHHKIGRPDVFSIVENNVGGHKLMDAKSGLSIIDATDLPVGQSIAEHIMGFQWAHEKVAIAIGAKRDELHALTRIVKPAQFISRKKKESSTQAVARSRDYDYGS